MGSGVIKNDRAYTYADYLTARLRVTRGGPD